MRSFRELSQQAQKTVKTINDTMQSGNVAISNFSHQVLPNAEQALAGVHSVTVTMDQLLNQLQQNPSVLVRGKQPSEPGPGE